MHTAFNEAMLNVRLSPIVSISEEVRKRAPLFTQETGTPFVLFQRGEIDFPTPAYIVEAAKRALDAGHTKYPKSGGEDFLKDAILQKLQSYNRAEGLTRENIVVTYGGQEALQLAFMLFRGKRGAGFAPCWSCVLENFVPYAAIDFTEVPLEKDFRLDAARLESILKGVTFFYLNSPHNPTGKLFTEEEVRLVADLCRRHGVYLVADEAYERIVYDGKRHFSPTSLRDDHIISAFTFSKTYAMTGWRLGYLVTRNPAVANLVRLADYTQTAGIVTFLQHAGREALENTHEGDTALSAMIAEYQKRRDLLFDGLRAVAGITVTKPDGGFYLFPNFTQLIPSSIDPAKRPLFIYETLMDHGVATVYGACFGKHFSDNVRLSFSTTPAAAINDGIARIRSIFGGTP